RHGATGIDQHHDAERSGTAPLRRCGGRGHDQEGGSGCSEAAFQHEIHGSVAVCVAIALILIENELGEFAPSTDWATAVLPARHVAVRHANINRVLISVREDRVYTGFRLWVLCFRRRSRENQWMV